MKFGFLLGVGGEEVVGEVRGDEDEDDASEGGGVGIGIGNGLIRSSAPDGAPLHDCAMHWLGWEDVLELAGSDGGGSKGSSCMGTDSKYGRI